VACETPLVGIPVIFEWGDKVKRTGASFHAPCPRCAQVVKMYEAVKNFNVSVFFAVSLWDDEEAVVQCGECLGLYRGENADLVRATAQSKRSVVGSVLSKLRSTRSEQSPPETTDLAERGRASASTAPKRARIDDASIDAELAALKKRLGK
jgi:hypothetical protein